MNQATRQRRTHDFVEAKKDARAGAGSADRSRVRDWNGWGQINPNRVGLNSDNHESSIEIQAGELGGCIDRSGNLGHVELSGPMPSHSGDFSTGQASFRIVKRELSTCVSRLIKKYMWRDREAPQAAGCQ